VPGAIRATGSDRRGLSGESDFIALMRGLAIDRQARGLTDDAAVLEVGGAQIVPHA
jgi:hypothetical protein